MVEAKQKKWQELCELATREQDPEELLRLTREINRILAEEEELAKKPQRIVDGNGSRKAS